MNSDKGTGERAASEFLIVGIGASAGGLEPLERLFAAMPPNPGMAFVVLQHLSPDFESRMDELLGRQTTLPIHRVTDGIEVEPNADLPDPAAQGDDHLAAGSSCSRQGGRARLQPADRSLLPLAGARHGPPRRRHRALRRRLRRLARHPRDPRSGRPRALPDAGDGALPEHAAGGAAVERRRPLPEAGRDAARARRTTRAIRAARIDDHERAGAALARRWKTSSHLLRAQYGIDFAHYKPSTVTRRIERRVALTNHRDVGGYAKALAADPDELNALYNDLLIGVTRFFRDPEAFETLRGEGAAAHPRRASRPTRRSASGRPPAPPAKRSTRSRSCSTRRSRRRAGPLNLRIFATDVHRASLDIGVGRPLRRGRAVGGRRPSGARATSSRTATATASARSCGRWSCSRSTTSSPTRRSPAST